MEIKNRLILTYKDKDGNERFKWFDHTTHLFKWLDESFKGTIIECVCIYNGRNITEHVKEYDC